MTQEPDQSCHIDVHAVELGEVVTGFFIVRKLDARTKRDGGGYLVLELGNTRGRVRSMCWDNVVELQDLLQPGLLVKVRGRVGEYEDRRQLTLLRIRPVEPEDSVTAAELIPAYPGDMDALLTQLDERIENVKTPALHSLLENLLGQEPTRSQFALAPAGKLWHHCYRGGLLEHSLSIAAICETAAARHPLADMDLLTTGALLHDFGKIEELSVNGYIDYSDAGRLIGHIVMESMLVARAMDDISDFPVELRNQVLHLLVSHQGTRDQGSPIVPQTLEAMILYYADELDSKAAAFERIIRQESAPGKNWSAYVNLIDRYLYLGNYSAEENSDIDTEP
jgi:3'-5' exoribonuclease